MEQLTTQVNQDEGWLSLQQVADMNGVTVSAVSHSLKVHSAIKMQHYKKMGRRGYLTKEGASLLSFRKSNAGKSKPPTVEFELNGESVKGQDLAAVEMSALMQDPLIQLRVAQLRQEKRITALEEKMESQPERIGSIEERVDEFLSPSKALTKSQRQYLAERCNALTFTIYGRATNPSCFSNTRKQMNSAVDRDSITDYTMDHFHMATRWLRGKYKEHGLEW